MATFDVLLSRTARAFVDSLNDRDREALDRALDLLRIDPIPDGIAKSYLPIPYRPGSIGFAYADFWIVYTLMTGWCIYVGTIAWRTDPTALP